MNPWSVIVTYEGGHSWRHDWQAGREREAQRHAAIFRALQFVSIDYCGPTSGLPQQFTGLRPALER